MVKALLYSAKASSSLPAVRSFSPSEHVRLSGLEADTAGEQLVVEVGGIGSQGLLVFFERLVEFLLLFETFSFGGQPITLFGLRGGRQGPGRRTARAIAGAVKIATNRLIFNILGSIRMNLPRTGACYSGVFPATNPGDTAPSSD